MAGLGLFAGALILSQQVLPEWQLGDLPPPEAMEGRLRPLAEQLGVSLDADEAPEVSLEQPGVDLFNSPWVVFGTRTPEWLEGQRRPVLIQLEQWGSAEGVGEVQLSVQVDLDGHPWKVQVGRRIGLDTFLDVTGGPDLPVPSPELVLGAGESLGEAATVSFANDVWTGQQIEGSGWEEHVTYQTNPGAPALMVERRAGDLQEFRRSNTTAKLVNLIQLFGVGLLVFLAAAALAFILAVLRRIDLANGAILAGISIAVSVVTIASEGHSLQAWLGFLLAMVLSSGFVFLAWAGAESWLRDLGAEPSGAFDALRRGLIGPRVGSAVLWGLGSGGAAAGLWLIASCLPAFSSAITPHAPSVFLPIWMPLRNPVEVGLFLACLLLLVFALVYRLTLGGRWTGPISAVLGGVLLMLASWTLLLPLPMDAVLKIALVGVLWMAYRWGGALALAVGGVVSQLLPALAFSAQAPGWLGASLVASALPLAGLAVLGLVGVRRPAEVDAQVVTPSFVRRLEEERRIRYEMALLARMQLGLLPPEPPAVEGWELAATTMLAHEVGGDFYDYFEDRSGHLWIAAGDVAGHGSFCSIAHAMTKAALASLIDADETPAGILSQVDRVLRTLNAPRVLTALALLKVDPVSGEALYANAGYPYPLLRESNPPDAPADGAPGAAAGTGSGTMSGIASGTASGTEELELPGLPLGGGPPRSYRDRPLTIPPGGTVVLFSDGLSEATGRRGQPYGFERPLQLVDSWSGGTAQELLEALVADWKRMVGGQDIPDDTTLLVIQRARAPRRLPAAAE